MKHTRAGTPIAVFLASTPFWSSFALAQDAPGLQGVFTFSQTIEATDNEDFVSDPSGKDILSRTDLGFILDTATRSQTFRLSLGTTLEGGLGGGGDTDEDFEFIRESARVDYSRENASTRLSLGASFDDTELDDLEIEITPDMPGFDPDLISFDAGSVQRIGATARLQTGLNARFGLDLSASFNETDFIGSADPDQEDTQRVGLNATARFVLTPTLTARALAGYSSLEEDDAVSTERDTRFIGVGVDAEVRSGLTFRGDLTFDEVETSATGIADDVDNGVGVNLALTQDRPNGSVGASLSSRVDESGRVTEANVNRQLELPTGRLAFSLGLLDPDDDSIRPVASLDYERALARGQVTAQLSQRPTTDDGDTVLNTAFRMNYSQSINAISSWSAGLSYNDANTLGADDDASTAAATVTYRRDLTRDWGLRAGYSYTRRSDSGEADTDENAVFLSLERDFSFGF